MIAAAGFYFLPRGMRVGTSGTTWAPGYSPKSFYGIYPGAKRDAVIQILGQPLSKEAPKRTDVAELPASIEFYSKPAGFRWIKAVVAYTRDDAVQYLFVQTEPDGKYIFSRGLAKEDVLSEFWDTGSK